MRCEWRADFGPASSASTAQPVTAPTHRSADTKRVVLDDKTVRPGFDQYTEIKSVAFPAGAS